MKTKQQSCSKTKEKLVKFLRFLLKKLTGEDYVVKPIGFGDYPFTMSSVSYRARETEIKKIDFSRKFSTRRYTDHSEMLGAFKHEVMSIIERDFCFYYPIKHNHYNYDEVEFRTTIFYEQQN
mgnify:CR=1 FL=1